MHISRGLFLLMGLSVMVVGCMAAGPGDAADEAVGDDELTSQQEEDVGEAEQPILPGQTMIQSSHDKCWNAYSGSVLNLASCNDSASRQSWVVDPNTWLIRSAHYWGKCAEIPKSATGKIFLADCDPYDSYQWFPFVPAADGQGLICGFVKDAAAQNRCASHSGGSYVLTDPPSAAPEWYRTDA